MREIGSRGDLIEDDRGARAEPWCVARGIPAMSVSFEALVHRPDEILPQLAGFLGVADKVFVMRACIDPALYRARKTEPPPN